MRHRTRIALLVTSAAFIAGCMAFGVRTFGFSFPAVDGIGPLPVLLTDASGAVVGVDAAPAGFQPIIDRGISNDVGNPNAVVVHWVGGACDASVDIRAESRSQSVEFTVAITVKPGGCDGLGVPRAVRILLNRPADMRTLGVRFEP